jgi:penicillin amidase
MLTLLRALKLLSLALIGAGLILLGLGYAFVARSLPDYDEAFALPGLGAEVEIVRTTHNVPHIFGRSDRDVMFGLGFAHAQDRLWQMTMLRRTAQGRLAEVLGPSRLQSDALMRRLDLYGHAAEAVEAQDAPTRAALEAYAAGVNAWIAEVNAGARGRGAPEFFAFDAEVAVWQPADSLAILKLFAFEATGHARAEVLRGQLAQILPERRLADILPEDAGPAGAEISDFAALAPGLGGAAAAPLAAASNAWAAIGPRAVAGGPLLANDLHGPLSAPGRWYLARVELSTGGVVGATLPGVPAVLAGRSAALGWGIAAAHADDQDVLIEKLNPDNPEEYLDAAGWIPFEARPSIVNVRGAEPVTLTLRRTRNGPVLTGADFGLDTVTPQGHVATLLWTGLRADDTTLSALLALNRAQSVAEAASVARGISAPALNLVLADRQGIGMLTAGDLPRRDGAHQTKGRMPAPGWIEGNRWQGLRDPDDAPRRLVPASDMVGTTNNRLTDAPFPDHISFDWGDSYRIQRWARLMQGREVHTRESFIEAQLDTVSPVARILLPLIGADLWFTGGAAPEGSTERLRARALARLAEWNGEMSEHLPEPLIATHWLRVLQDRLIRDEVGPLADILTHLQPAFVERVFRDTDGASVWCDVIRSAPVETCTDIAREALDAALLELVERWGPGLEGWRWGDAHEARHDHQTLGTVPGLRHLVNIRQSSSGDDFTLNRGVSSGRLPDRDANVHAAGYRAVYDFADPDSSVFIIAAGQSGHPLSRHYDDLGVLWRRGEYIPMTLDPDLARAGAIGITRLRPGD